MNKTRIYLHNPLMTEYPEIKKVLRDKKIVRHFSTFIGHKDIDKDNNIYVHATIENKAAINRLIYLEGVVNHYPIGGLFSNDYMIVIKSPKYFEKAFKAFKEGKYSEMYTTYELNVFRQRFFHDMQFYAVVTKSATARRRLEKKLDVELDKDAELDDIFRPEREVYDYQHQIALPVL